MDSLQVKPFIPTLFYQLLLKNIVFLRHDVSTEEYVGRWCWQTSDRGLLIVPWINDGGASRRLLPRLARHIQHLRWKSISPGVVDLALITAWLPQRRIPTSPLAECVWSSVKMGRTVLQLPIGCQSRFSMSEKQHFWRQNWLVFIPERFYCVKVCRSIPITPPLAQL